MQTLLYLPFLFSLIVGMAKALPAPAEEIIARVNGKPIHEKELRAKAREGESQKKTLRRIILYRLAIEDAQKQGLEKDPDIREQLDQVLYKNYLDRHLARASQSLEPSEGDLKKFYEKYPLLRLRQLILRSANEGQNQRALKIRKELATELKKGADFKQLVLKYSDAHGLPYAGDLDFRGPENLPAFLYRAGLSLKVGETAGPLFHDNTWHYIQLLDKKSFKQAPATYLAFLRGKLKREREETFLKDELAHLEKKAHVEIVKGDGRQ